MHRQIEVTAVGDRQTVCTLGRDTARTGHIIGRDIDITARYDNVWQRDCRHGDFFQDDIISLDEAIRPHLILECRHLSAEHRVFLRSSAVLSEQFPQFRITGDQVILDRYHARLHLSRIEPALSLSSFHLDSAEVDIAFLGIFLIGVCRLVLGYLRLSRYREIQVVMDSGFHLACLGYDHSIVRRLAFRSCSQYGRSQRAFTAGPAIDIVFPRGLGHGSDSLPGNQVRMADALRRPHNIDMIRLRHGIADGRPCAQRNQRLIIGISPHIIVQGRHDTIQVGTRVEIHVIRAGQAAASPDCDRIGPVQPIDRLGRSRTDRTALRIRSRIERCLRTVCCCQRDILVLFRRAEYGVRDIHPVVISELVRAGCYRDRYDTGSFQGIGIVHHTISRGQDRNASLRACT